MNKIIYRFFCVTGVLLLLVYFVTQHPMIGFLAFSILLPVNLHTMVSALRERKNTKHKK